MDLKLILDARYKTQNWTSFINFVKENSSSLNSLLDHGLDNLPVLFREGDLNRRKRILLSDSIILDANDQDSVCIKDIDPKLFLLLKQKNLRDQRYAWEFMQTQRIGGSEILDFRILSRLYNVHEAAEWIAEDLVEEKRIRRELARNIKKKEVTWRPRHECTDLKPKALAVNPYNQIFGYKVHSVTSISEKGVRKLLQLLKFSISAYISK